jgi:hypothetical protein
MTHFSQCILTGMHQLLVTNKGQAPFPSADHCQGQLQTPQSLAVYTVYVHMCIRVYSGLRTSGMLRCVGCQLDTLISEQPICPIFES